MAARQPAEPLHSTAFPADDGDDSELDIISVDAASPASRHSATSKARQWLRTVLDRIVHPRGGRARPYTELRNFEEDRGTSASSGIQLMNPHDPDVVTHAYGSEDGEEPPRRTLSWKWCCCICLVILLAVLTASCVVVVLNFESSSFAFESLTVGNLCGETVPATVVGRFHTPSVVRGIELVTREIRVRVFTPGGPPSPWAEVTPNVDEVTFQHGDVQNDILIKVLNETAAGAFASHFLHFKINHLLGGPPVAPPTLHFEASASVSFNFVPFRRRVERSVDHTFGYSSFPANLSFSQINASCGATTCNASFAMSLTSCMSFAFSDVPAAIFAFMGAGGGREDAVAKVATSPFRFMKEGTDVVSTAAHFPSAPAAAALLSSLESGLLATGSSPDCPLFSRLLSHTVVPLPLTGLSPPPPDKDDTCKATFPSLPSWSFQQAVLENWTADTFHVNLSLEASSPSPFQIAIETPLSLTVDVNSSTAASLTLRPAVWVVGTGPLSFHVDVTRKDRVAFDRGLLTPLLVNPGPVTTSRACLGGSGDGNWVESVLRLVNHSSSVGDKLCHRVGSENPADGGLIQTLLTPLRFVKSFRQLSLVDGHASLTAPGELRVAKALGPIPFPKPFPLPLPPGGLDTLPDIRMGGAHVQLLHEGVAVGAVNATFDLLAMDPVHFVQLQVDLLLHASAKPAIEAVLHGHSVKLNVSGLHQNVFPWNIEYTTEAWSGLFRDWQLNATTCSFEATARNPFPVSWVTTRVGDEGRPTLVAQHTRADNADEGTGEFRVRETRVSFLDPNRSRCTSLPPSVPNSGWVLNLTVPCPERRRSGGDAPNVCGASCEEVLSSAHFPCMMAWEDWCDDSPPPDISPKFTFYDLCPSICTECTSTTPSFSLNLTVPSGMIPVVR